MKDIDEYGKFTEDIWFSKHQTGCNIFKNISIAPNNYLQKGQCNCDTDPERSLMIMTMGLAGEVGEVMEILKKRVRDGNFDDRALEKELGDVAYYWARLCKFFEMEPSEVLQTNVNKLQDRLARGAMRGSGDNR